MANYLTQLQWDWNRAGFAFDERFQGQYISSIVQDQIMNEIEQYDSGGGRLRLAIDQYGSTLASHAITELEADWKHMQYIARH